MSHYTHEVPGGAGWSLRVPRGRQLRLEAAGEGACVSTLLFAAADPLERLNVPDTLKAQMSGCVRPPMVLMSDLGKALCSVTGSSLTWHDAICGHSLDRHVARFGPSDYATHGNGWRRSARSLLLDELEVLGLGRRDLHACVNWFTKVAPSPDGQLSFTTGYARAGDWVTLRAEQDVLVVLATSPHPLDASPDWRPAGVRISVGDADAFQPVRAEATRALELAERS
jgi:urea carboxylase-associated protein 2